jgi:hypothetical protein
MLFFDINKKWYVIERPKYPKNAKLVDEKRPYLTISFPPTVFRMCEMALA